MRGFVSSGDGVGICYEVHGQGSPTLVFVHGWSCDRSYWTTQVAHFSQRHRVVTVDLAGHGDSGLKRTKYTMEFFGEDVAAVVRHVCDGSVALIGHSMGGYVIVEAALRIPDRVMTLVGVDAFPALERDFTPEEIENSVARMGANFVEACRAMVSNMFLPSSDPGLRDRIIADMSSAPVPVGISASYHLRGHRARLRRGLLACTCPKTAINSDRLNERPDAYQRYGIALKVMSGVGHFVMMEDPKTFNALLEDIISDGVALASKKGIAGRR